MTQESIAATLEEFTRLYRGQAAQFRRDNGEPGAMPPWAETYWLGKQVAKSPMDLWVYQEIIHETKPELIIECGTSSGGSAYFFATVMDALALPGKVITIDVDLYLELYRLHPRIQYCHGSSVDPFTQAFCKMYSDLRPTMVSLDSDHSAEHVARELELYAPLVTPGCYIVVEDTGTESEPEGPGIAAREFLQHHPEFVADRSREKHLFTANAGGWLKRL